MKIGILADTHITINDDPKKIELLISQLNQIFNDVDEIIHAGDLCEKFFLDELNKIAPTKCVKGNLDKIEDLEDFIKFSVGCYNIGVIHQLPQNLEDFIRKHDLNVLIHGHDHQPIIEGTSYNTLLLNPGSPTKPKAPPPKAGFEPPIARPSVLILNIDENDIISTFIINLDSIKNQIS
ncbi:MAG: metallophosphoesterase family protein [Candidatus Lokiarchaeota archaeon]|nr:metallophosphoesterase family protein [Candidatus Lokiarchaeota archaeon]